DHRVIITSRLILFEKLPRIEGNSNEYIPNPPNSKNLNKTPRYRQINKNDIILFTIRLNDERRLEKEFNSNDKIFDIIKYVKSQQIVIDDNFYLSSEDIPKKRISAQPSVTEFHFLNLRDIYLLNNKRDVSEILGIYVD
ncbi:unnamed protein product, partial [Rotaria sp. Silwood2]